MSHELLSYRLEGGPLFACEICGEARIGCLIALTRHDVSDQVGLAAGSVERIIRHCCDRRDCIELAEDPQHWRIVPEGFDPWEMCDDVAIDLNAACDAPAEYAEFVRTAMSLEDRS